MSICLGFLFSLFLVRVPFAERLVGPVNAEPHLTFEQALYVWDPASNRIYPPGNRFQKQLVEQMTGSAGWAPDALFEPILYRSGLTADRDDPNKVIMVTPFDPAHPEIAKQIMTDS